MSRLLLAELIDAFETAYLPEIPDSAALYKQQLGWWRQELGAYSAQAITPQLISECKVKLAGEVTYRGRLRLRVRRAARWRSARSPEPPRRFTSSRIWRRRLEDASTVSREGDAGDAHEALLVGVDPRSPAHAARGRARCDGWRCREIGRRRWRAARRRGTRRRRRQR